MPNFSYVYIYFLRYRANFIQPLYMMFFYLIIYIFMNIFKFNYYCIIVFNSILNLTFKIERNIIFPI